MRRLLCLIIIFQLYFVSLAYSQEIIRTKGAISQVMKTLVGFEYLLRSQYNKNQEIDDSISSSEEEISQWKQDYCDLKNTKIYNIKTKRYLGVDDFLKGLDFKVDSIRLTDSTLLKYPFFKPTHNVYYKACVKIFYKNVSGKKKNIPLVFTFSKKKKKKRKRGKLKIYEVSDPAHDEARMKWLEKMNHTLFYSVGGFYESNVIFRNKELGIGNINNQSFGARMQLGIADPKHRFRLNLIGKHQYYSSTTKDLPIDKEGSFSIVNPQRKDTIAYKFTQNFGIGLNFQATLFRLLLRQKFNLSVYALTEIYWNKFDFMLKEPNLNIDFQALSASIGAGVEFKTKRRLAFYLEGMLNKHYTINSFGGMDIIYPNENMPFSFSAHFGIRIYPQKHYKDITPCSIKKDVNELLFKN